MPEIRMIALDLDRTFLRTDKSISDYSISVIDRCRKKGIRIGIATARSEKAAQAYISRIQPDIVISDGGARVRCGEETVWSCMLPENVTEAIVAEAVKEKACVNITVEAEDSYYVTWEKADSPDYEHAVHCDFSDPFRKASYKITLELKEMEAARRIAQAHPECSMIPFSGGKWYRFAHRGATKMNGVRHAAEYLSIDTAQIAAFGDDLSDKDMIEGCGTGVAMGNAIDAVKSIADAVCQSNDEDGAARWIEENILGA